MKFLKSFRSYSEQTGRPTSRRGVLRRACHYVIGFVGASLIAATPPEADAAVAQLALDARVEKVREAMREVEAGSTQPETQKLAQWWNNWPNWGNWGNWPNWPNWGNWFNR